MAAAKVANQPIKQNLTRRGERRVTAKERFDRHCETCQQCHEQYSKPLMCAEERKLLAAYWDEEEAKNWRILR